VRHTAPQAIPQTLLRRLIGGNQYDNCSNGQKKDSRARRLANLTSSGQSRGRGIVLTARGLLQGMSGFRLFVMQFRECRYRDGVFHELMLIKQLTDHIRLKHGNTLNIMV
jgi:hypothetical protein